MSSLLEFDRLEKTNKLLQAQPNLRLSHVDVVKLLDLISERDEALQIVAGVK